MLKDIIEYQLYSVNIVLQCYSLSKQEPMCQNDEQPMQFEQQEVLSLPSLELNDVPVFMHTDNQFMNLGMHQQDIDDPQISNLSIFVPNHIANNQWLSSPRKICKIGGFRSFKQDNLIQCSVQKKYNSNDYSPNIIQGNDIVDKNNDNGQNKLIEIAYPQKIQSRQPKFINLSNKNLKTISYIIHESLKFHKSLDFNQLFKIIMEAFKEKNSQRIRRRMYDALNVLRSAGVIQSKGKKITLPNHHQDVQSIKENQQQQKIRILKQQIALKKRNLKNLQLRKKQGGKILNGLKKIVHKNCHRNKVEPQQDKINFPMVMLPGDEVEDVKIVGQETRIKMRPNVKFSLDQNLQEVQLFYLTKCSQK